VLQYLIPVACALWAFGELFRWPVNRMLPRFSPKPPRAALAGAAA